jgi:hypothetical protein
VPRDAISPRLVADAGPAREVGDREVLGVPVADDTWLVRLPPGLSLSTGTPAKDVLRVPVGDAQRLLRDAARTAAGIPAGGSPAVVFTSAAGELLVHTGDTTLTCGVGLVSVGVPVSCDQQPDVAVVTAVFAVGTEAHPAGLVMVTPDRPTGPAALVEAWGASVVAFAWQALLQLAGSLCAAVGSDWAGSPLVPGSIAAADATLLLTPMARHRTALTARKPTLGRPA